MSDEQRHEGEVTIAEAQTVKVDASQPSNALPLAVFLGLALIAAAIYFGPAKGNFFATSGGSGSGAAPPPAAQPNDTTPKAPVNVTQGDLPVLGKPNAPVLIVEWGDYQCPFCGRLFEQVEPQVRQQYVETGKVRWAYRDFAFLGQESVDAAMAARCANEQEVFWAYHDMLFESQEGENQGTFSREKLKGFARELGLDTAAFNTCLDSEKYEDAVTVDTNAGRDAGVSGTPTTFVNGRVVNGAQPFDVFAKIIDEELAK